MPVTLSPENPNVFVCREGHVSRDANGISKFTCRKIVRDEDDKERPCRLKALVLDEEFAHALHRRGWEKSGQNIAVVLTRMLDEIAVDAPKT